MYSNGVCILKNFKNYGLKFIKYINDRLISNKLQKLVKLLLLLVPIG